MSKCEISVLGLDVVILLKALCDYASQNATLVTESQIKSIIEEAKNDLNFDKIEKKENYGPYNLFINLNPLKKKVDYLNNDEASISSCIIDFTEYNNFHGKRAGEKIVKNLYIEQFEIFKRIFGDITGCLKEYKKLKQIIIDIKKQEDCPSERKKYEWFVRDKKFYQNFFGKLSKEELTINIYKAELEFLAEIFCDIQTALRKYNNIKFQLFKIKEDENLLSKGSNQNIHNLRDNNYLPINLKNKKTNCNEI